MPGAKSAILIAVAVQILARDLFPIFQTPEATSAARLLLYTLWWVTRVTARIQAATTAPTLKNAMPNKTTP